MAAVARDQIVQVLLLVHPVAQRDDDVALDALRPLRLRVRQLALGDAVGPVAEVLERRIAEVGQLAEHLLAGLARLHAPLPRLCPGGERAKRCGMVRVDFWPSWWQPMQPLFFIAVEPLDLRRRVADAALAVELLGGRDLQHRVPVDRRVVLRGGGRVRRRPWR